MRTKEKGILPSSELFFSSPSSQAKNLFFYVTCTGHFMYEDTYVLRRENYNSYLVMHIARGSARIEYDNISYVAQAGDTVLINCHKPHTYLSLGDLETIWFHFDGANASAYYRELSNLYHAMIVAKNSGGIVNRVYKIYDTYKYGKKIPEAIQSSYIARILGEFFQNPGGNASDKSSIMNMVMDHIEENFEQDLSVGKLASIASLSEYHFSRLFKQQTGFTIHEFIIRTRIINAKILLKSTTMSLKEIAYRCGFSNESSFSNTFRRVTGMTPGTFRRVGL